MKQKQDPPRTLCSLHKESWETQLAEKVNYLLDWCSHLQTRSLLTTSLLCRATLFFMVKKGQRTHCGSLRNVLLYVRDTTDGVGKWLRERQHMLHFYKGCPTRTWCKLLDKSTLQIVQNLQRTVHVHFRILLSPMVNLKVALTSTRSTKIYYPYASISWFIWSYRRGHSSTKNILIR